MPFKPVSSSVDFVELEHQVQQWWQQEQIVAKYLAKNQDAAETFSFLDGPITANNPMGVHHAWGRTYKDTYQRFHTMLGHRQRYQNGFDEQGLWVEVEVERELGLKNKRDILNLVPGDQTASLEKFINLCKERVNKFAGIQTEQSKRLGYFMDWDNSYHTSSPENNYSIWHFLQVCHQKGWLYKGFDSVPWCPRCGTAISQMEILTEEYKELTHQSVFFKLPLKDRPDQSLLVWTTTPWTIPANVAAAVNGQKQYQLLLVGGEQLWVMAEAVERLKQLKILAEVEVRQTLSGSQMVGWLYEAPFDDLPLVKEQFDQFGYQHRIIDGKDLVTPDEGTGLLHVAPGAGAEDFKLGKDLQLPLIAPIEEDASYVPAMGFLAGQNAKLHPEVILDYLSQHQQGRFLLTTMKYKHRYPTCWRCKTELVWRVVDEWYIAVDRPDPADQQGRTFRQQMIEVAKSITWLPHWGLSRELDWLNNLGDWLISKKRFWGLALPIYEDTDGSVMVIGSRQELEQLAVEGWEQFADKTPHRPWIDQVKIRSPKTGDILTRIPDVGNPWLDAGIVPFSTMPAEWFPADFITESFPGQFKNWFYALIAMSTVLRSERQMPAGEPFHPFRTVLGFATVRDEHGREMHKSAGNSIEFNEAAEQIGAESMRWQYVTANPEHNLNFGFGPAREIQRRYFLIWWNIYNFFVTYANLDGWSPEEPSVRSQADVSHVLDRWISSRLSHLIDLSTTSLSAFDAMTASRALEHFIVHDVSTWYLRRSRDRVGPTASNALSKQQFYATMYQVLTSTLRLGAPYLPYLTEAMYSNLTGSSVHLSDWPKATFSRDERLEAEMALARQVVEAGHAAREQRKLKLKQPLAAATYTTEQPLNQEIASLVATELNVLSLQHQPSDGHVSVELDETMTEQLREMGMAREIIRSIQAERKKLGCTLDARINVTLPDWPDSQADIIKQQTLAERLDRGPALVVRLAEL